MTEAQEILHYIRSQGPASDRLLTAKEVADMLGISLRKVWSNRKEGLIPSPVQLTPTATRWRESDLLEFIKKLPTGE